MKKLLCLLAVLALLAQPLRAEAAPQRYLALTFDDGPSGELTEQLLEGLAERQVHATFFVCAYRIAQFPDTLSHIAAAGHEIGLHSSCHDYMQKLDKEALKQQPEEVLEAVGAYLKTTDEFFYDTGDAVPEDCVLTVRENPNPFVSRGGLKLQKAVTKYDIDLNGLVAMDVGASTGGFTDCMLQHGAKKVYSIDVGYGQLDWRLRNDERVKVMERMNARNMTSDWFDEEVDFASMDVSFISIKLILPAIYNCLKNGALAVILVKPQFEAGRDKVGKKGVVRELSTHVEVIENTVAFMLESGFRCWDLIFPP